MIPAQLNLWEGYSLEVRVLKALHLTRTTAAAGDLAWLFSGPRSYVSHDDVWEALMHLKTLGEVVEVGGGFWRAA